jgi:Cytochrome C oxidase, cbb3-type, subunit III
VFRAAATLVVLSGVLAGEARAQGSSTDRRTTMAGVYTEAQAAKGRDTFASLCTGCHTVASHTGPAFMNNWRGYPLSELFGYMSSQMPKSDPGSLAPTQYVQLIAYILKLNGMPAGLRDLPVDGGILEKITIDTTASLESGRGLRGLDPGRG